jgi:hypothetical protein
MEGIMYDQRDPTIDFDDDVDFGGLGNPVIQGKPPNLRGECVTFKGLQAQIEGRHITWNQARPHRQRGVAGW